MSANIFKTEVVKNVKGKDYLGTYLIQVPYFLEGILSGQSNAILNYTWIQKGNDAANNGGYNLFKVFVDNLLAIVYDKVLKQQINLDCYERFKKSIYCNFIRRYVDSLLIFRDEDMRKSFKTEGAMRILMKHYGWKPYFYFWTAITVASRYFHKIFPYRNRRIDSEYNN